MNKKLQIVLLGILILAIFRGNFCQSDIGFCAVNNNSGKDQIQSPPVARLTYKADSKKGRLKFSQNQIYLKVGDCFTVKSWGLSINSDCLPYLDANWQTTENLTEYTFTALQAGEIKMVFTSTTSKLKGEVNVLITNNITGKSAKSEFKQITYKIENKKVVFSENELIIRKGVRFLVTPEPKAVLPGKIGLTGDYARILDRKDFTGSGADCFAFKAVNKGLTFLEFQTISEPLAKGTFKVYVLN